MGRHRLSFRFGRVRMIPIFDAPPAPRGLLFLATFSKRERAEITSSPHLLAAIRAGSPAEWPGIMRQHREAQRAAARTCVATTRPR